MVLRKTVIINIDTNSNEFKDSKENKVQRIININFIPDEVILRSVTCNNIDAASEFFILRSDIISGDMCSFGIAQTMIYTLSLNHTFTLGKQINDTFYFQLLNDKLSIVGVNDMLISFVLEFVKY